MGYPIEHLLHARAKDAYHHLLEHTKKKPCDAYSARLPQHPKMLACIPLSFLRYGTPLLTVEPWASHF
jgi:hypothetical protein